MAVDVVPSFGVRIRQFVGRDSDDWAIPFVLLADDVDQITAETIVDVPQPREACESRSWVAGNWVEIDIVYRGEDQVGESLRSFRRGNKRGRMFPYQHADSYNPLAYREAAEE